jgi:Glycosyltransferases involved in cell wall biogenesis
MVMINYSIVIPHKDIPQALQRCLDSIPQREDLQVIVVDDNSSPDIVAFQRFPGLDRPNVEIVFTKEGKGAGYARNVGLSKAVGEWIIFSDSDDFFLDNMLDVLDKYKDSEYDMIFFNYDTRFHNTLEPIDLNVFWGDSNNEQSLRYDYHFLWSRMIRRSMIEAHHIRCHEVLACNDIFFAVKAGESARTILKAEDKFYCWTKREGSLMHTNSEKTNYARLIEFGRFNRFCKRNRLEFNRINCVPIMTDHGFLPALKAVALILLFDTKESAKASFTRLFKRIYKHIKKHGFQSTCRKNIHHL